MSGVFKLRVSPTTVLYPLFITSLLLVILPLVRFLSPLLPVEAAIVGVLATTTGAFILARTKWKTAFLCIAFPLGFILLLALFSVFLSAIPAVSLHRLYLILKINRVPFFSVASFSALLSLVYARYPERRPLTALIVIFCGCLMLALQGPLSTPLFAHPLQAVGFLITGSLLLLVPLFFSTRSALRAALNTLLFILFLVPGILASHRLLTDSAVKNHGGLIQPTLFQFDFAPFLTLRNEIRLNEDLVLVAHVPPDAVSVFLRRMILGGWSPEQGFFEASPPDTQSIPRKLPTHPVELKDYGFNQRRSVDQEYFIVNFDPSSVIAMDYPTAIRPYRLWNTTSFKSGFAVTSSISPQFPVPIIFSDPPTGTSSEGLSAAELEFYTRIDPATKAMIDPLVSTITASAERYYETVFLVEHFLKNGDYRYSLRPGIAPDGDQLRWFLFDAKQGYCTYFAFSMCLMLRAAGIPSRLAVGFFILPDTGELDYYPVRGNTAHAWVEVFFPYWGWISFDPTTDQLADDQEAVFGSDKNPAEFMTLLKELIENRRSIRQDQEPLPQETSHPLWTFISELFHTKRGLVLFLCALGLCLIALFIHLYPFILLQRSRDPRRKIHIMVSLLTGRIPSHLRCIFPVHRHRKKTGETIPLPLSDTELEQFCILARKAIFGHTVDSDDAIHARILFMRLYTRYNPVNRIYRWITGRKKT